MAKHHFIPRHYLRGFADPSTKTHVWVYRRGKPYSPGTRDARRNPFRQAIRSAGQDADFYAMTTLNGVPLPDRYEQTIKRQEELGLTALRKLRTREPVSDSDKAEFSFYIDLMIKRVPARAAAARPIIEAKISKYPWTELAWLAASEGKFNLAFRLDPQNTDSVRTLERQLQLEGVIHRSKAIATQIASMTWHFVSTSGDHIFPTTDNPAFFSRSLGLRNENGFLVFPIDSHLALLASNIEAPDRLYVQASPAQHALLSRLILTGATASAYARHQDRSILEVLNSRRIE